MYTSPIQLVGSKFERIVFTGDGTTQNRVPPTIRYAVDTEVTPNSEGRIWTSSLTIELMDPSAPLQPLCTGLFVITGQFQVLLPDEQMPQAPEIIASNAPAMLYSSVRELAYALAVRTGLFGFILPTVYFQSLHAAGIFGDEDSQPTLPLGG